MSLFTKPSNPIFLKETSTTTEQIETLKRLQEKASGKLKDEIERELSLINYGEIGEKNIAFELKNAGIPLVVIHDLHLQHGDQTAQIDYVVVTKKQAFFIECKNLYGNIDIDNQGNFIRSYQWNNRTVKEGIYSPITQNQRHLELYRQIRLTNQKNPIIRMGFESGFNNFHQSIVVLSNPKTILNAKYAKKDVKEKVIRADQLIQHIKNQIKASKELSSNEKSMMEWAERILALHQPMQMDYANKYKDKLDSTQIIQETKKARKNIQLSSAVEQVGVSDNDTLVKALKDFRLKKSREENVKAYYIFTDKQLENLLEQRPESKAELLNVSGFGAVKTEKYGDEIIEILLR
ncbi:MAG: HRDC domain-containing protein [Eubacteriaceae bacterium]